jgi:hypothetical protein
MLQATRVSEVCDINKFITFNVIKRENKGGWQHIPPSVTKQPIHTSLIHFAERSTLIPPLHAILRKIQDKA